MERGKVVVVSAVAIAAVAAVVWSRHSDGRLAVHAGPSRVAAGGRKIAEQREATLPNPVQRTALVSSASPPRVAPVQTPDTQPPLDVAREADRRAWSDTETKRATAMAQRLALSPEQTVKFVALKRAHNEARASAAEILRENPGLTSPEAVESILAERLGVEAVLALRQRSHLQAVHAIIGDDRFADYQVLIDSGDWEDTSPEPPPTP